MQIALCVIPVLEEVSSYTCHIQGFITSKTGICWKGENVEKLGSELGMSMTYSAETENITCLFSLNLRGSKQEADLFVLYVHHMTKEHVESSSIWEYIAHAEVGPWQPWFHWHWLSQVLDLSYISPDPLGRHYAMKSPCIPIKCHALVVHRCHGVLPLQ